MATITINALPHEIILRIVEWTDVIARHDRLVAEEEAHMAAHQAALHAHDHDHDPAGDAAAAGHDLDALIDGGPVPPNGPGGNAIGGQDFMANLFDMFGGPPGPAGPQAQPGANAAPPAPNANGNGNANGPNGLFGTLMQALGAGPGQGMPATAQDDESDEEMPGKLFSQQRTFVRS